MNLTEYLSKTVELMQEMRVPIRDTYGLAINLDDFYSNGNRYGGPCLLKIDWIDTPGSPEMKGNKIYHVPPYQSAAYDAYSIVMPNRYKDIDRDDPVIHELVHFLQHNTAAEDSSYLKFTGHNYSEYLSQRVELEAHIVQVSYILRANPNHRDRHLNEHDQELVSRVLSGIKDGGGLQSGIPSLLLCKERGLI